MYIICCQYIFIICYFAKIIFNFLQGVILVEWDKNQIKYSIQEIRRDIGHEEAEVNLKEIIWVEEEKKLIIITPDRPDKSAVIGKGGWVVGRLKETLGIKNVHVTAYVDIMVKIYRMQLSLNKIKYFLHEDKFPHHSSFKNLLKLLSDKIENPYDYNFLKYMHLNELKNQIKLNNNALHPQIVRDDSKALVALSGGVDSSFSLILAKYLGFNPEAVTIDPGTIILPEHYKKNIEKLTQKLGLAHQYLDVDFTDIIKDSLDGRYHPCGRCSKLINQKIYEFAKENNFPLVIFGDLLSTGYQSVIKQDDLIRINLPACLGVSKMELKKVSHYFGVKSAGNLGCPLLGEVEKKFPHMSRYSMQRVLRETRAGALEPGEALELIWSSLKHFK